MMLAGFAEYDITPPIGTNMPGAFDPKLTTEPPRGKLLATAAAFEAAGEYLILTSVDALSLDNDMAARMRRSIAEQTGVPMGRIMLVATHTHTGGDKAAPVWFCPGNPAVEKATEEGIVKAAVAAFSTRKEAKIGVGHGEEKRYGFCRDIYMTNGTLKMNPSRKHPELMLRPAETPDYSVDVMRVEDSEGNPVCYLVNYANHPDCHGTNKKSFSADFPGALRRNLKRIHGEELKVLFFNGTAGDINCIDWLGHTSDSYYGGTKNAPEAIGAGLSSTVVGIDADIRADMTAPVIDAVEGKITVNRRFKTPELVAWAQEVDRNRDQYKLNDLAFAAEYLRDDDKALSKTVDIPIYAARLGDWAIVGLPGEIFTAIGRAIKVASPFKNTVIFELANGCYGYISTALAQEYACYEARISQLTGFTGPETAELMANKAIELLWQLANKEK